jgi:hypothetical protein
MAGLTCSSFFAICSAMSSRLSNQSMVWNRMPQFFSELALGLRMNLPDCGTRRICGGSPLAAERKPLVPLRRCERESLC